MMSKKGKQKIGEVGAKQRHPVSLRRPARLGSQQQKAGLKIIRKSKKS
jgi:hypothetical protein